MNIKTITIINFKSIGHFEYNSSDRLVNVFVGDNGAGKSSVLQALKILYSWFAARIRNPKGNGLAIGYEDIKNGEDYCFLKIIVTDGNKDIAWQLYRQRLTFRGKPLYKTSLAEMSEYVSSLVMYGSGNPVHWPVMSFYGVSRSISNPPLRIRKRHKLEALDLYDRDAIEAGSNFNAFFYWFREKEDLENEMRLNGDEHYRDKQLECVRMAIERVFSSFSNFRVNRRHKSFEITKNREVFRFSQLSDGEKCYLGLVMDVARVLAITAKDADSPLESSNVVLIDEVDLHLHPKWQARVLDNLRQAFPRCQFFITTHSPYVLSDVDTEKDNLFKVNEGEIVKEEANTYGKTVSEILLYDFDQKSLRNEKVSALLSKAWETLRTSPFDKSKLGRYIRELRKYIPTDIELVKLDIEYRRKEADNAEK